MATRDTNNNNFNDASKNGEITVVVGRFELSWLMGFKSLKKKMLHEFELIKV